MLVVSLLASLVPIVPNDTLSSLASTGRVEGVVWVDTDGDGARSDDELGLADVELSLMAADGSAVDSALSDDSGKYSFEAVAVGAYAIRLWLPDGYEVSPIGSDADPNVTVNAFAPIVESGTIADSAVVAVTADQSSTANAGLIPTIDATDTTESSESTTTTTAPATTTTTTVPETTTTTVETTTTTTVPETSVTTTTARERIIDKPGFGLLAVASSQQWATSVAGPVGGPGATEVGSTRTFTFGTSGVTMTETVTALTGSCQMASGFDPSGPNTPTTFWEPDPVAATSQWGSTR